MKTLLIVLLAVLSFLVVFLVFFLMKKSRREKIRFTLFGEGGFFFRFFRSFNLPFGAGVGGKRKVPGSLKKEIERAKKIILSDEKKSPSNKNLKSQESLSKEIDKKSKKEKIPESSKAGNLEISKEDAERDSKGGSQEEDSKDFSGEGNKINISKGDFKAFIKNIKDPELVNILDYLKGRKYSIIGEKVFNRSFDSKKEIIEFVHEEIVIFLKDEYEELKSRISDLRKSGKRVGSLNFKLMTVPLKIKVFEAGYHKKDFDKVISIIDKIEAALSRLDPKKKTETKSSNNASNEKKDKNV